MAAAFLRNSLPRSRLALQDGLAIPVTRFLLSGG